MLVGELESKMDYTEHRLFPHCFDFGHLQGTSNNASSIG